MGAGGGIKMSMEYCHYCDQHIDTDFDAEHFILNEKGDVIISCVRKEQDEEVNENE